MYSLYDSIWKEEERKFSRGNVSKYFSTHRKHLTMYMSLFIFSVIASIFLRREEQYVSERRIVYSHHIYISQITYIYMCILCSSLCLAWRKEKQEKIPLSPIAFIYYICCNSLYINAWCELCSCEVYIYMLYCIINISVYVVTLWGRSSVYVCHM